MIAAKNSILNAKEYQGFLEHCATKKETWQDIIIPPKNGLEQVKGLLGDKKALYILLVHEFIESLLDGFLTAAPPLDELSDEDDDKKADIELKMQLDQIQQGFERLGKKIADRLPKIPKLQRKPSEEQTANNENEAD